MLTGKMQIAHTSNQSGDYHYFPIAVVRQLQRYVRHRWSEEAAPHALDARSCEEC